MYIHGGLKYICEDAVKIPRQRVKKLTQLLSSLSRTMSTSVASNGSNAHSNNGKLLNLSVLCVLWRWTCTLLT